MNPADCQKCGSSKSMCVCGSPEEENDEDEEPTDLEGRLEKAYRDASKAPKRKHAGVEDDSSL